MAEGECAEVQPGAETVGAEVEWDHGGEWCRGWQGYRECCSEVQECRVGILGYDTPRPQCSIGTVTTTLPSLFLTQFRYFPQVPTLSPGQLFCPVTMCFGASIKLGMSAGEVQKNLPVSILMEAIWGGVTHYQNQDLNGNPNGTVELPLNVDREGNIERPVSMQ
ncbi:uncharacterized protein EI90DRAFT_3023499 [Cantharellus anzutake]|uniref:uncharacterized protein n=1 Tax=Cantharellus anzutake TaxID=1750568 RepID=UPI00190468F3|nr:uncharacterized protein EI90DRAFT_3023499 [Cantharellus anzutake]KAF8311662.1 hypothetical protein EI90DRAFT_3023499 [Cantharellus anzutake]